MEHFYYHYAGLRITSELEIPEWTVFEQSEPFGDGDISIHLLEPFQEEQITSQNLPIISLQSYQFYVPTIGHYRVESGHKIMLAPVRGANLQAVRLYLLGSAMGALLYQRGLFPIHGSILQVGNGTVAFCGTVGAGKSTLVAHLTRQGYPLVCDDLCRWDLSNENQVNVWPAAPSFKLWRDTIDSLGWTHQKMERDHVRYDKFHVPYKSENNLQQQPLPLRAIYILALGELNITRLSGKDALNRFISAATYRHELIEPMGLLTSYWRNSMQVVSRVPVWELKRSRNLLIMDQTINLLKSHWMEMKLLNTKELSPS